MQDDKTVEYLIQPKYAITLSGKRFDIRALLHHHKIRPLLSEEVANKKWLRHPITNEKLSPQEVKVAQERCISNSLVDEIEINEEDGSIVIHNRLQGTRYAGLIPVDDVQEFATFASVIPPQPANAVIPPSPPSSAERYLLGAPFEFALSLFRPGGFPSVNQTVSQPSQASLEENQLQLELQHTQQPSQLPRPGGRG